MSELADDILQGAEAYLNKKVHTNYASSGPPEPPGAPRMFAPEGYVPEESMMHPDIDEDRNDQDNWSEEEVPAGKRVIIRRVF